VPVRCSKSHKVADERKMAQKFQAISEESLFLNRTAPRALCERENEMPESCIHLLCESRGIICARLPCVIKWPVYILAETCSFFLSTLRKNLQIDWPEIVNNANVLIGFLVKLLLFGSFWILN
jgi:hypothetical protein